MASALIGAVVGGVLALAGTYLAALLARNRLREDYLRVLVDETVVTMRHALSLADSLLATKSASGRVEGARATYEAMLPVFAANARLQTQLKDNHPLVAAYNVAVGDLVACARPYLSEGADWPTGDDAMQAWEKARDAFDEYRDVAQGLLGLRAPLRLGE
jgi:hypothetical protein